MSNSEKIVLCKLDIFLRIDKKHAEQLALIDVHVTVYQYLPRLITITYFNQNRLSYLQCWKFAANFQFIYNQ